MIKTSTFVAAGILALAGTPVALHLMGGSKNGSTASWIKTLHGGGGAPSAHHASANADAQKPSEKPAPQSTADLTGKWSLTIESPQGTIETHMVLKQVDKKLTGAFGSPHGDGDLPMAGERADNTITLAVDAKTDHGDMHVDFKGTIKKEDGSLAGTMTSAMGESKWTATRAKN